MQNAVGGSRRVGADRCRGDGRAGAQTPRARWPPTRARRRPQDEQARTEITAKIKGIFDATKTDVEKILGELDTSVAERFEDGEKAAKDAFTADHKARMERYKDERY